MEGGQSITGGLLDHVITTHPAYPELLTRSQQSDTSVYQLLEQTLHQLATGHVAELTRDLHVWPDYHGNRSPLADPGMTGAVVGVTLQSDVTSLALIYLATVQALCYGTRHIVETLVSAGHEVDTVTVCGGVTKSKLFLQTQADVLQMPVMIPQEKESVLLGAAMLGMSAASDSAGDLVTVARSMSSSHTVVTPCAVIKHYHDRKYRVFLQMMEDQLRYRDIMNS